MSQSQSNTSFRPVPIEEIPLDSENYVRFDLYVYLSLQKRFVLYIPQGERFTQTRKMALTKHSVPCVYLKEGDTGVSSVSVPTSSDSTIANFEVIGLPGNKALAEIFEDLSKNIDTPPPGAIGRLEKMADDVLSAVAPDAANIKSRFAQNMDYMWLMNDASAISTIATTFAAANDINTLKPLRDIVFASLVMDLPLAKIEQSKVDTFYRNRNELPKWLIEQIEQHPFQAYQLAKKTLAHLSDTTFELILSHHEKYNGEGFPRKLRSIQIFPLGQIFALAVEVFEFMKVNNSTDLGTLEKAVLRLYSDKVEPHLQVHRREIVLKIISFLNIDIQPKEKSKANAAESADSKPGDSPSAETIASGQKSGALLNPITESDPTLNKKTAA